MFSWSSHTSLQLLCHWVAAQLGTQPMLWLLYAYSLSSLEAVNKARDGPQVVNTVPGRPSMVALDGWVSNEQRGQTFSCVNYSNTRPHAVTYPLANLVLVHMHFTVNAPRLSIHKIAISSFITVLAAHVAECQMQLKSEQSFFTYFNSPTTGSYLSAMNVLT